MIDLLGWLLSVLLGLSAAGGAPAGPVAERVELEVGHCWVEPVEVDGVRWNVPLERQVGWGGGLPRAWKGRGLVTVLAPDRAAYLDDGGSRLPLRPADDPGVSLEGQACR